MLFSSGASTTILSAFDRIYVGGTASSTIRGDGVASTLPFASTTMITATTASTTNLTISGINSGSLLKTTTAGAITAATLDTDYLNNASSIETLGDVAAMTEAFGDVLSWNGSSWTNSATSTLKVALSDTTGTLAVNRGGTGLTAYTLGDVLYASGTGTLAGTTTANLKTTLALNNVENTALSTWAGSTNLTTLGTIVTGVWNGTTIAIGNGGTGTTTNRYGGILWGDGSVFRQASTTGLLDYDPTQQRVTLKNASTTMISATTASSTNLIASSLGAAACDVKATNGVLSCGSDANSGLSSYDAFTHPSAGYSATTSIMLFSKGGRSTSEVTSAASGLPAMSFTPVAPPFAVAVYVVSAASGPAGSSVAIRVMAL